MPGSSDECLLLLSLLTQSWIPASEWRSQKWVGPPTSVNIIKVRRPRCAQRAALHVILDSVKLTILIQPQKDG